VSLRPTDLATEVGKLGGTLRDGIQIHGGERLGPEEVQKRVYGSAHGVAWGGGRDSSNIQAGRVLVSPDEARAIEVTGANRPKVEVIEPPDQGSWLELTEAASCGV